MATTILLLRHAEKPEKGGDEAGVDAFGKRSKRGLTPRGWQRAGALVRWVVPKHEGVPGPIARPTAIFAAAPYDGSERALLTVQPLAKLLKLRIRSSIAGKDVARLLKAVDKIDGAVLVSWRHQYMDEIAQALCPQLQPASKWDESVFDRAWLFTCTGERWQLREILQRLLPGDTEKLLSTRS